MCKEEKKNARIVCCKNQNDIGKKGKREVRKERGKARKMRKVN